MRISIKKIEKMTIDFLCRLGFSHEDSILITNNIVEAELSGKKTHGLVRLYGIANEIDNQKLNIKKGSIKITKNFGPFLLIDGENRPGYILLYKSLDYSLKKVKELGISVVSIKDVGYSSGYISSYAKIVAKKNLIFIGMNSSPSWIVPHGTNEPLWGTNPLTVGIPNKGNPIILDMATSKIAQGLLAIAMNEKQKIPVNVAVNAKGMITTNPSKAVGLLPIAEHKGSGLAFVIELMTGALSGSKIGKSVRNGWGSSFYLLINPKMFRNIDEFQKDIKDAITELRKNKKSKNIKKILYPGELSQVRYEIAINSGKIDIDAKLLTYLKKVS